MRFEIGDKVRTRDRKYTYNDQRPCADGIIVAAFPGGGPGGSLFEYLVEYDVAKRPRETAWYTGKDLIILPPDYVVSWKERLES